MATLEATLSGSGASWTASLDLLTTREPVTATGTSAVGALGALVRAALRQVADEARVQGVALPPAGLVASEAKIRAACSLALFKLQNPTPPLTILDPLGTDVSTFAGPNGNDLDVTFKPIGGQRAVAEAVARRWLTPLGALVYDPTYGEDLTAQLNADTDRARLTALSAALAAQAEADERVQQATVTLTASGSAAGLHLTVKARLVSAAGPFSLVLTVTQLAANLEILRT